jgi:hypothetical protein
MKASRRRAIEAMVKKHGLILVSMKDGSSHIKVIVEAANGTTHRVTVSGSPSDINADRQAGRDFGRIARANPAVVTVTAADVFVRYWLQKREDGGFALIESAAQPENSKPFSATH